MKALLVAVVLVGCKQADAPPAPAPAPAPAPVAVDAKVVADAAALLDAPGSDADPTTILDTESIGGLKFGGDEKAITAVLGAPKSKSKAEQEGATMDYVSDWQWPNVAISMVSETGKPPWKARLITVKVATLETTHHIHVGSTRAEVAATYKRSEEDEQKPEQFLVGSIYGGLLFDFKGDRVVTISMGPFAF